MKNIETKHSQTMVTLWIGLFLGFIALLFARLVFADYMWITILVSVVLIADLGALIFQNRKNFGKRSSAFGARSSVSAVLVLLLVGVLNFLASRYLPKTDLTKNKQHTLSDQTLKVVKDLKSPIKAVLYAKPEQSEENRFLFDNYKSINPLFQFESVNPVKEPTRAKQAQLKKLPTLILMSGARETRLEEFSEEKLTNALIKVLKDKMPKICALVGHGERSFDSNEQDGFAAAKKGLAAQSYEVKELNLFQEGKIPADCDGLTILGPHRALFEQETKLIAEYLANGGRAVITLEADVKGVEASPEINTLLHQWYIEPKMALVIDPMSRMFGADASVPIITQFSKTVSIAKEFQGQVFFPFARPLNLIAAPPASINLQWVAKSNDKSWGETDFNSLAKGQVSLNKDSDIVGPVTIAASAEGKLKDSKATKNTRIVVFGSTQFATNQFSRFAANEDLFLNAVSWILEDESMISIRTKEEEGGKLELSQTQGNSILILTVILAPLLIVVCGIWVWVKRRTL